MSPQRRNNRRRIGHDAFAPDQQTRRRLARKKSGRTKRPADEIPPLHPHALYRPGRICTLLDIDKSTLWRWRKQGILPPFTVIGGIEGLTGEQLMSVLQQREPGQS